MLQSLYTCIGFSLDYMRVGMTSDPLFDILYDRCYSMDSDNSNSGVFDFCNFDFVITRNKEYFIFRPIDFPFPVFRVQFDRRSVVRFITFDFYSAFFRWPDYWRFWTPIRSIPQKVTRLDIALDLAGCMPADIAKYVDSKLPRTSIHDNQTVYFGAWKSNRKIIRVYDKKADTEFKGKSEIFPELEHETRPVSRIELELRTAGCQRYKLSIDRLDDLEYQYHIFYKELTTKYVYFPLVPSLSNWVVVPSMERATPDPVLRFREAISKAYQKGVDIRNEVVRYLSM